MNNHEKYADAFISTFDIKKEELQDLKYQDIQAWDSVGHMGLIDALETAFEIEMSAEDIIDFSSFEKGKEILSSNYGVEF